VLVIPLEVFGDDVQIPKITQQTEAIEGNLRFFNIVIVQERNHPVTPLFAVYLAQDFMRPFPRNL